MEFGLLDIRSGEQERVTGSIHTHNALIAVEGVKNRQAAQVLAPEGVAKGDHERNPGGDHERNQLV
jgi:hypothetical protein